MNNSKESLEQLAAEIRMETIKALAYCGGGHIGGALSIADCLAVLYGKTMRYDPKNPKMESRDRLVLSKGHCGPVLYAVLAIKGFFPKEELKTINQNGTILPSHCDMLKTPGIDITTGSLGQGISMGAGVATALKIKQSSANVFVIVGDGELQEGQTWEAIQYAAAQRLKNFILIVDNNKKQLDGYLADICPSFDIEEKLKAFGFTTATVNAHDISQLSETFDDLLSEPPGPIGIVLDSVKGKGWSYVEEAVNNHHMVITQELVEQAKAEILG